MFIWRDRNPVVIIQGFYGGHGGGSYPGEGFSSGGYGVHLPGINIPGIGLNYPSRFHSRPLPYCWFDYISFKCIKVLIMCMIK